jgi:hypothetical protein
VHCEPDLHAAVLDDGEHEEDPETEHEEVVEDIVEYSMTRSGHKRHRGM